MLQIRNSDPLARYAETRSSALSPRDLMNAVAGLAQRRFGIMLLVFSVTVVCCVIYLMVAPPKYLAEASLIIDTRKTQLFQQQNLVGDANVDSAAVDSQIEVMKSEAIAASVVKNLHLTSDPEFVGSRPGIFSRVVGFLLSSAPTSEADLQQRAQDVFRAGLLPKRVGNTYVIGIGYLSLNPQRAAQAANAAADAYIDDQLEAKYQATRKAGTWLQERIQELRQQASAAERAVLEFKKANNIVDTGGAGGRLIGDQQLTELQSQLTVARASTAEARARLDRIGEITKNGPGNIDDAIRKPDAAVADVLRSEIITKLRTDFLDTASRESVLLPRLGKDHLVVVNLHNQLFELRKAIFDEVKRIEESYKSEYQIAIAREQSIQKSLAEAVAQNQTTNQAQVSLKDLTSNAVTYRAIHDNFVQRYMESLQQQSFPYTEARVISHAVGGIKSQPNSKMVITLATASGVMLALGVALLIDLAEGGFRTTEQVETELRTSCLAVVPVIKPSPEEGSPQKPPETSPFGNIRQITRTGINFGVIATPFSRFAEAFRTIKVGIDLYTLTQPTGAIGITSTHPGEGKSTISANLARLIAHAGGKAVLLDCDLRNPSLSRSLAPSAEIGLLDVLSGKRLLTDVLWTDPATSLTFVPMVASVRLTHSNEILASASMKKLIDGLREIYDYILIDLPPLNPVVDVRSTGKIVDSFLFVIEWGATSVDVVERALASAPMVYDNLMGVVLNKVDMDTMRNYSRSAGERYKSSYYERYGFED